MIGLGRPAPPTRIGQLTIHRCHAPALTLSAPACGMPPPHFILHRSSLSEKNDSLDGRDRPHRFLLPVACPVCTICSSQSTSRAPATRIRLACRHVSNPALRCLCSLVLPISRSLSHVLSQQSTSPLFSPTQHRWDALPPWVAAVAPVWLLGARAGAPQVVPGCQGHHECARQVLMVLARCRSP